MKNILFSIYTNKHGHQVVGFAPFDSKGKNAFDQAIEYAQTNYNDINDKPKLFLLSEISMPEVVFRTPAEWEAILKVEVIDPDGWRAGCRLTAKDIIIPITETEFRQRCEESTIYPLSFESEKH
jgi:hypothetical protein